RKRQIDQNSCNKDFSCINGFCPSFVTVEGGERAKLAARRQQEFPDDRLAALPDPVLPRIEGSYDLLVTGVGGTGVITVGALITMAAHLEGKGASVLDFTGFAQKFGPVLSYVRLAQAPEALNQVRIDRARADALIGCDLVVSSSPKASATYRAGHTRAAVNSTEMSTADFVRFRDANLRANERIEAIRRAVGELSTVAANELAEQLLGNTIYSNVLMLGYAWQRGLVPVSADALLRAIELNGVEIENNRRAFGWGRLAAAQPELVEARLRRAETSFAHEPLESVIERRVALLTEHQDRRRGERYGAPVERAARAGSEFSARRAGAGPWGGCGASPSTGAAGPRCAMARWLSARGAWMWSSPPAAPCPSPTRSRVPGLRRSRTRTSTRSRGSTSRAVSSSGSG